MNAKRKEEELVQKFYLRMKVYYPIKEKEEKTRAFFYT